MPYPKTQLIRGRQGKQCRNSGFQSKSMGHRIEDATDPRVQQVLEEQFCSMSLHYNVDEMFRLKL